MAELNGQPIADKTKRKYSFWALIGLGAVIGFFMGATGSATTLGFHAANIGKAFKFILLGIACGVGATLTLGPVFFGGDEKSGRKTRLTSDNLPASDVRYWTRALSSDG